jgi:hypothetical protein
MANLVRNDLIIEGKDVSTLLEAIGFKQRWEWLGEVALIDFSRIREMNEWDTYPYGGYQEGDILELTSDKAHFKFYTKNIPAWNLIDKLSDMCPDYRYTLDIWELTNGLLGRSTWEGGYLQFHIRWHYHPELDDQTGETCRFPCCPFRRTDAEIANDIAKSMKDAEQQLASEIASGLVGFNIEAA